MTLKENISIKEFDDKNYQIRLDEQFFEEPKAILTHYLCNIDNKISEQYKDEALKVLN